jgi:hypothetical protein
MLAPGHALAYIHEGRYGVGETAGTILKMAAQGGDLGINPRHSENFITPTKRS